jgi:hypothetical protein
MERRVSKLSITTDDLERRENLAKRINKTATNRLRQQHEQFEGNRDFAENEINQEIKRLHSDLQGIREIGNYNVRNSTHETREPTSNVGMKRKRKKFMLFQRKAKTNSRRKLNREEGGRSVQFYPENPAEVISVENYKTAGDDLPRDDRQPRSTLTRDDYIQHDNAHGISGHEARLLGRGTQLTAHERTKLYEHDDRYKTQQVGHERLMNEKEARTGKHKTLPRITRSGRQESAKSGDLDVHEARNQARKRLLGEHGQTTDENETDANLQTEQETTSNDEIESYMYVPPDGRKRTVYLLPPLDELLKEASKARYLRMPKRCMNYEDDPERELSIDEIFSKRV